MIAKAKKYLSSDLLKVSSLNALSTIIRMLASLISVKFVATLIGPSGIALLGQLNNFTAITQNIASAGITQGVTKYVAENKNARDEYTGYLGTGFWITMAASVVSSIVIYLLAGKLSVKFLGDPSLAIVFQVYAGTLVFFALNAFLLSAVNGFKDFRTFFFINVAGSVIGLVFTIVLTHYFSLKGTLIATVTFQSIVFLFTALVLRKSEWFRPKTFQASYNGNKAVKLWKFSVMALISAFLVPLGQLIIRGAIIRMSSITDAGLWEGVNRISNIYLLVAITSLSVYFLPRLSELNDRGEIRAELKAVYKLMLPALALCATGIYTFRHYIISILFSGEFAGMKDIMHFQLAGDIIKMAGWVLGYLMLAKVMIRPYIILELMSFSAQIGLAYVFVPKYGSLGATIAYALSHLIYFSCALWVVKGIIFSRKLNG